MQYYTMNEGILSKKDNTIVEGTLKDELGYDKIGWCLGFISIIFLGGTTLLVQLLNITI